MGGNRSSKVQKASSGVESTSRLQKAVSDGNLQGVRSAIRNGADVNCMVDTQGDHLLSRPYWDYQEGKVPVLCIAVKHGNIEIIQELIKSGADVNKRDSKWRISPLHVAAKMGNTVIVEELVCTGADVDIEDRLDYVPMWYAAYEGHIDVVKLLIGKGGDVNPGVDDELVGRAAVQGLMEHGDDGKYIGIIRELLHNGAIIDLAWIIANDRVKITQLVKEMNECWEVMNQSNKQLLNHWLTLNVTQHDLLLFQDPSYHQILTTPDEDGITAMHYMSSLGNHEAIKTLLDCGVNVRITDGLGRTLLHCAIPIGNKEMIKNLMDGCDIQKIDKFQRSVLHYAAFYGHCELIYLFISSGLNPNDVDCDKRTALHMAVIQRNEQAAQLLIQHGADVSLTDQMGLKPSDYLHPCEKGCFTSRVVKDEISNIPALILNGTIEPNLDITKVQSLYVISKTSGFGSVECIDGFDMDDFQRNIKGKISTLVKSLGIGDQVTDLIGCGSSTERTKVGLPDEVDYLIPRQMWALQKTDEGYLNDLTSSSGESFVTPSLFLWYHLIHWWTEHLQEDHDNFQMPFPPVRHPEHPTCVNWVWLYSDDVFKMLPVSIDLVMAKQETSEISRTTWLIKEIKEVEIFYVPKIPEEKYLKEHFDPFDHQTVGRISYPTLECKHMLVLEDRVKNVYITAKCLRFPEICGFKVKENKDDIDMNNVGDYVTSYRIKTVFLHLVEVFLASNLSLGRMVLLVYEKVEECLENKEMPMFFDASINVFAGSRADPVEGLKVARVMRRFVKLLYKRDFQSVLEQDAEEMRRIQHLIPEIKCVKNPIAN